MQQAVSSDWLDVQAEAKPDGLALTFKQERWCYRELHEAVNAMCARLAGLRLQAGEIIATHLPNTPAHVVLVHAAARLGWVLAPLNTRLTNAELRAQLNHLKPAALMCGDEIARDALAAHARVALTLAQLDASDAVSWDAQLFELERVQAIVFTSGSSGAPKGVEMTFGNHFHSAMASASRLGTLPNDCWLSCLPLYHVGGLAVIFRTCVYGSTVALHERFDLDAINAALDTQPITMISLVPTMLKRLLETRKHWPASLRLVLLGGAAADENLLRACIERGIPVAPTYGLTEAASQVATMRPQEAQHKIGSVGQPLSATQVSIVDDAGRNLPNHEIGEVVVRGPTVMRGYLNNAEATAHALRDGALHTGDLGYLDADGDLWLVQRRSDLIVSGGENVYPAEVERVLRQHPTVDEALVVGLADAEWGQRVAALVALKNNSMLSESELIDFVRTQLAGYKLPRDIRFVAQLPMLANGKVDRAMARSLFTDG